MAIARNGIHGSISGRTGDLISYELNGQLVVRTVGRRTKRFSPKELLNQAKMRVVSEFLAPIKPFVLFGFRNAAPPGSRVGPFQMAQSHTRKYAVEVDENGDPYVNPEKVLISKGTIAPPRNCTVEREGNRITMSWETIRGWGGDRLVVLLYDGDLFRDFREIGPERSAQTHSWEDSALTSADKPIHVYAAFRDTYHDRISDSVYCGAI
ncbi:DUF6266 family protein [Olivibacter sp. XZL3]|uniref:DUF6266 family protein n=1 Tax=Olivibacter sp. XZL3 TaxID=1735116 RepID=UPI00106557BE|nr:DUF6266 family protein [Olivibacter sp. XZL3]